MTGRTIETVHVIGGGAQNRFLCRLTANVSRRAVLAGPVEAAALGNVLVQLHAFGEIGSLAEMRELVRSSTEVRTYEPDGDPATGGTRSTTAFATLARPRSRGSRRMTTAYDLLAEKLAARGDEIERVEAALREQKVETPSWAFGNSGTRFAVFAQPGAPRTTFEKLEDAAEVHRHTAIAPSVALHIPWDRVDDFST